MSYNITNGAIYKNELNLEYHFVKVPKGIEFTIYNLAGIILKKQILPDFDITDLSQIVSKARNNSLYQVAFIYIISDENNSYPLITFTISRDSKGYSIISYQAFGSNYNISTKHKFVKDNDIETNCIKIYENIFRKE